MVILMDGGGYQRVLPREINHQIGNNQRLERTKGIPRQQGDGIEDRTNLPKYGSDLILRLVISYFSWIWVHSLLGTTAAQRTELTDER